MFLKSITDKLLLHLKLRNKIHHFNGNIMGTLKLNQFCYEGTMPVARRFFVNKTIFL